jgi:pimeloyl-ACP methyl ester carboxylesterase
MHVGLLQRLLGGLIVVLSLAVGMSYAPDRPAQALVARWALPPSDFIELGGQVVHLRDEGPRDDAEPLVLLHGLGDSLHTWQGWADALRGQRRVIRFDLPGAGLTGPTAAGDYRADADARFTLALLDRLGVRRYVAVGHSMGGEAAFRLAAMAPGRVARLVLLDSAGYRVEPGQVPVGFALARLPLLRSLTTSLTPRALVAQTLRSMYGHPDRLTSDVVDRTHELLLREGNRDALVQRLRQHEPAPDADSRTSALLRTVAQPTLILWGGQDRLIPPATAERFRHDIARSRVVVFDDLGHLPQQEDPKRTAEALRDFLRADAR